MIKHSIIIISYNQEKFISESIESCLNQTEKPYEIIIVDDFSTDNTWNIINSYNFRYDVIRAYRNSKNLGLHDNIKVAHSYITGNIVNHCAGDDLLEDKTLESISRAIIENKIKFLAESE